MTDKPKPLVGPIVSNFQRSPNLGELLFDTAEKFKDKICQIDANTDEVETYSSVKERSIRVALALEKKNIASPDVVVVLSDNNIDTAIPILACLYLGIAVAHVDPSLSLPTLRYIFRQLSPALVFVDALSTIVINECLRNSKPDAQIITFGQQRNYEPFSNMTKPQKNEQFFSPTSTLLHEVAVYTVSSTVALFPKIILHSHYSFYQLTEIMRLAGLPFNRILHFGSYSWLGNTILLICTFMQGGTRVFCHNTEDSVKKLLTTAQKYQVETLYLVPSYAYELCNIRFKPIPSLQKIMITGNIVSLNTIETIRSHFSGVEVIYNYGLSEVGLITTFSPDDSLMRTKPASCGKVVQNSKLKVVRFESREIASPFEIGTIWVKSPGLMKGYCGRDYNQCFDKNGYFGTDDVGYYDDDGYVYILGRLDEIIKCKGFVVIPNNIEFVMLQHPAVKEAAVLGVPHEEYGTVPMGYVVLKPNCKVSEKDIINFVNERVTDAEFLRGGIKIVHRLPKTADGKIVKWAIKTHRLD